MNELILEISSKSVHKDLSFLLRN